MHLTTTSLHRAGAKTRGKLGDNTPRLEKMNSERSAKDYYYSTGVFIPMSELRVLRYGRRV